MKPQSNSDREQVLRPEEFLLGSPESRAAARVEIARRAAEERRLAEAQRGLLEQNWAYCLAKCQERERQAENDPELRKELDREHEESRQDLESAAAAGDVMAQRLLEADERLKAYERGSDDGLASGVKYSPPAPAPIQAASSSPTPAEKKSEQISEEPIRRQRQEPSQDEQPGLPRAHDVEGLAGPSGAHDDWVSKLTGPGSTRPSGRRSGPHGWMG